MKKKFWLFFFSTFLLLFCLCLAMFSSSVVAQEFSARIRIEQPEETFQFDYFVKDHLYRLEGKDSSGEPMVIIANRKDDSYIGLHPIMKFYMEFSREEMFLFNPIIGWEMITNEYEEEKAGTEVIAGFECEKYVYTQQGMDGVIEAWYSPELNQRIKIIVPLINSEQSIFELLDIKLMSQSEEKFRVPADYEIISSPAEQVQAEEPEKSSGISSSDFSANIKGESPIGRILAAENIMQVKVIPSLEKNLVMENISDKDASMTIIPYRSGEAIDNQIIEKTISAKGKTKPSFSSSLKVDEIEIKINEGTVKATVLQESFFTDEIERNEYYLFENFGQGLFFSEEKQVQLMITGDNETSGISKCKITFFKGEYENPIEKLELSLQNSETRQWEFQPGEVKTMDIVTGDSNGGVKVILEQWTPKKRELSKEEIDQLVQDIYQNNLTTVHKMLQSGIDQNLMAFATDSLLMTACAHGTADMVSLLLDYQPDIHYQDMYGNNALTKAADNYDHYQKIVPMLLNAGINPNSKVGNAEQINSTAFGKITARALQKQDEEDYQIIKLFLEKDVDVNLSPKTGTTPLMQAVYKGNLKLVKLFLEYKADPNLKDAKGLSALDMAKNKGHKEILKSLEQ